MASVTQKIDLISEELTASVDMLKSTKETGITNSWNTRSDFPVKDWIAKIETTDGDIAILCYAMSFLVDDSNFDDALLTAIRNGNRVRILFGDPTGECIKSRTLEEKNEGNISERIERAVSRIQSINQQLPVHEKIEIKYHNTPLYASVYIWGSSALITPQLYATRGALAPILEIKKTNSKQCIYNKYYEMFEAIWAQGVNIDEAQTTKS